MNWVEKFDDSLLLHNNGFVFTLYTEIERRFRKGVRK